MQQGMLRRDIARTIVATLALAGAAAAQEVDCDGFAACRGWELEAALLGDVRTLAAGGVDRGTSTSALLQLGAAWRADGPIAGTASTTSVSILHLGGGAGISGRRVGDLQGLNNIEAPSGWVLYDLWTEIAFGGSAAPSVRAGFLDLNAEFDTSETAAFFIGPPFGIGTDLAQTGENGPAIFPVTGLGLRLGGSAGESTAWRLGVYEAVPGRPEQHRFMTVDLDHDHGALLIGEIDFMPEGLREITVGAWRYTATFERIDAVTGGSADRLTGNQGAYAFIDAPVFDAGGVRVDGMLRFGIADARFNAVNRYAGAALLAHNLLPGRPYDDIGVAIAHARTSAHYRFDLIRDGLDVGPAETSVELTWRTRPLPWLAIAPTLQWVDAPGTDRRIADAWVAGVRLELSHARRSLRLARESAPSPDGPMVSRSSPP